MHYSEFIPPPSLQRVVRCIWELRASAETQAPVERVLPDGCGEIIINLADPFTERVGVAFMRQPRVLVVGQLRRFLDIAATGCVDLIGIRCEPTGLRSLLGVSAAELTDQRVDLAVVSRGLQRRLLAAARVAGLHARRQALLRVLCAAVNDGRGPHSWLPTALCEIERSQGRAGVRQLARSVHCSDRQLERVFRDEVGMTPKVYARIVRFQSVLRRHVVGRSWAELAVECGYSDQAHLIRDFRSFAGVAPAAYFRGDHVLSDHFTGQGSATRADS
ncbi:MAG: helix-turn-helix domain-containing protein [Planctomycetota bacterium]